MRHQAKLISRKQLTDEVDELKFDLGFDRINHLPGQYISIIVEPQIRRHYSLSNIVGESLSEFDIIYDKRPNGYGVTHLNNLSIGDKIDFIGPVGKFLLPENPSKEIYFIATGTGLGPLISMIDDSVNKHKLKVHLIFGTKRKNLILYYDKFEKMNLDGLLHEYKIYVSQEEFIQTDLIKKGRVTKYFENIEINTSADYILCGNGNMIESVCDILVSNGVSENSIHYEKFSN